MAHVPPRSRLRSCSLSSFKDRSPLETLQHMGFSKERSEKAIAATGNRGIQIASEWLLNHASDVSLDNFEPRDYILYLCPTGELGGLLADFWDTTFQLCGWNSAHVYFPHITLTTFFKLPNSSVSVIDHAMSEAAEAVKSWPATGAITLDLVTQNNNFIGYFVTQSYQKYIENLMKVLQKAFHKHGFEMKPQNSQLHMTLAFQYDKSHHDLLLKLAQEMDACSPGHWELRVYSREAASKKAEARRVIKDYVPAEADELGIKEGDFVFMEPEEHERSPDGWFKGTSLATGDAGFFPGNFTVKSSQMNIWTLHRKLPLPFHHSASRNEPSLASAGAAALPLDTVTDTFTASAMAANGSASASASVLAPATTTDALLAVDMSQSLSLYANTGDVSAGREQQMAGCHGNNMSAEQSSSSGLVEDVYAKVNKPPKHKPPARKLHVVRHGERCDFTFNSKWFERSFDANGKYTRIDINCPRTLVPRESYRHFSKDCPLTEIGKCQARITGEALRDAGETVSFVYCSPALRCVETATEILKGLGSNCHILVEPSLFEWLGWYKPMVPSFLPVQALAEAGYPVETSYTPHVEFKDIVVYESIEQYYTRSSNFTRSTLRKHQACGGNILFVGHSVTLDACSRQLRGKPVVNFEEFRSIARGCPYCFVGTMTEDLEHSRWCLSEPPVDPLTHQHNNNKQYSWKNLL